MICRWGIQELKERASVMFQHYYITWFIFSQSRMKILWISSKIFRICKQPPSVINAKQDYIHSVNFINLIFLLKNQVSPPTLFASINSFNSSLLQIKEELSLNRRRTSELQIDRFVEAMEASKLTVFIYDLLTYNYRI